jgi:hypothetical protein
LEQKNKAVNQDIAPLYYNLVVQRKCMVNHAMIEDSKDLSL